MNKIINVLVGCLLYLSGTCQFYNDIFVDGYIKRNGKYVQPHFRTTPNNSMFDNYSTKGNYNPYTGKTGWIAPYNKVSSLYYNSIPNAYKFDYTHLFNYLNKKDSLNYFRIIDAFDYEYKMFFTGIFKINNNETKEANKIFKILKNRGGSNFIYTESSYWFDITSKYIQGELELDSLYDSADQFQKDGNYFILIQKLNNIKNPLNFYHKYLIALVIEYQLHNYSKAISSYDSMIAYTSENSYRDSLILQRADFLEGMKNYANTIKTKSNGTYFYTIQKLADILYYFMTKKVTPLTELKNACFEVEKEDCCINDSAFVRSLWDTSRKVENDKNDRLKFYIRSRQEYSDTTFIVSLIFFDDSSYLFYNNQLSILKSNPISKSLAFSYNDSDNKQYGFEYVMSEELVAGLITTPIQNDKKLSIRTKMYNLYLYCIINKEGRLYKLSDTLKK